MQVLLPRSAKASSLIAGTALLLLASPAIAGNDPTPNPGDTTWMLTSSLLVLMMSIPPIYYQDELGLWWSQQTLADEERADPLAFDLGF